MTLYRVGVGVTRFPITAGELFSKFQPGGPPVEDEHIEADCRNCGRLVTMDAAELNILGASVRYECPQCAEPLLKIFPGDPEGFWMIKPYGPVRMWPQVWPGAGQGRTAYIEF